MRPCFDKNGDNRIIICSISSRNDLVLYFVAWSLGLLRLRSCCGVFSSCKLGGFSALSLYSEGSWFFGLFCYVSCHKAFILPAIVVWNRIQLVVIEKNFAPERSLMPLTYGSLFVFFFGLCSQVDVLSHLELTFFALPPPSVPLLTYLCVSL